jgi:glutamate N-acetyltransferase/amino-acid N-acetyltransferase
MKLYQKALLPKGFKASAVACGIKKSGKLDLALLYSDIPTKVACSFTTNKIKAAPLLVDIRHLKLSKLYRALIVNSGNANCFTGQQGLGDAEEVAKLLARALRVNKKNILVSSTGIIGRRLPVNRIKTAIPELVKNLSVSGITKAKKAIMTTDTFAKEITVKFHIGNCPITICGIAKGAGMIAPNMATMLSFIMTDANIAQSALKKALKLAIDNSFNCITVDGCMSTNDMVCLLANSASTSKVIDRGNNFQVFLDALKAVCLELAKMIVQDAEGASKFITIKVKEAKSFPEAKKVALAIANSTLVKTAMYGENPNFGRVVAAVGSSGIEIKEKELKIKVSPLYKNNIDIQVSLNRGNASAVIYTSDLTPEYIKINAAYS